MTNTIYSLNGSPVRQFYDELSKFADAILTEASARIMVDIEAFATYRAGITGEKPRAIDEYTVEYVALGVFLEAYGAYSLGASALSTTIIEALYRARKKSETLKPHLDRLRGFLSALLLYKNKAARVNYDKAAVSKLLMWMKASGEFKEESQRTEQWAGYVYTLPSDEVEALLSRSISFARFFQQQGKLFLGDYTTGVGSFLTNEHRRYKFREDYLLCGRSETEYHLNMFGAEVLNRVLKAAFDKTRRKVLLLPTCMCHPVGGNCKATLNDNRLACTGCSASCRVNVLGKEMKAMGEETFLIPHSSSFSKFLKNWQNQEETGLIGVACVLHLLTGGYEMQRLNIPSQCVFLNYPGCMKHWHPSGIATEIATARLLSVLKPASH